MAYGVILGQTPKQIKNPTTIATNVSYNNSQTSSIITGNNVQKAIDELFTSVSNGKELVANAITDKGVVTSATDTFATMAENIREIATGLSFTQQMKQGPAVSQGTLSSIYNYLVHSYATDGGTLFINIMDIPNQYVLNLSMAGNTYYNCYYTYPSTDTSGQFLAMDASNRLNGASLKFYFNTRNIVSNNPYGYIFNTLALASI